MNDYIIIESTSLPSLAKSVVEKMDEMYFPLGNITVYPFEDGKGNDRLFYQAMASYK
jgi:hypothetical protein